MSHTALPALPAMPTFHTADVVVTPKPDGKGANSVDKKFYVTCTPPIFPVHSSDAVLNYRLVEPTPKGIEFVGYDAVKRDQAQVLSKPSISIDGKMMTFNDRVLSGETILITLRFRDVTEILFDPEVQNNPVSPKG